MKIYCKDDEVEMEKLNVRNILESFNFPFKMQIVTILDFKDCWDDRIDDIHTIKSVEYKMDNTVVIVHCVSNYDNDNMLVFTGIYEDGEHRIFKEFSKYVKESD